MKNVVTSSEIWCHYLDTSSLGANDIFFCVISAKSTQYKRQFMFSYCYENNYKEMAFTLWTPVHVTRTFVI